MKKNWLQGPLIGMGILISTSLEAQTSPSSALTSRAQVDVSATGCKPETLKLNAGDIVFTVNNRSKTSLTWGVLNKGQIVVEQPTIAAHSQLKTILHLMPGHYTMICGHQKAPQGQLVVGEVKQEVEVVVTPQQLSLIHI